jgi:hypothetical protein
VLVVFCYKNSFKLNRCYLHLCTFSMLAGVGIALMQDHQVRAHVSL